MDLEKEIQTQMHDMLIRKEQMQELCKRQDGDVFDITYNVSDAYLRKVDPSLDARMKERAAEGKKCHLDPTKTPQQKAENFQSLLIEIDRLYNRAMALLLENLKAVRKQRSGSAPGATPLGVKTALENAGNLKFASEIAPETMQQEAADVKKNKGKKAAAVERVSLAEIQSEMETMSTGTNNSVEDEKYRAYNESVRSRASENEKSESAAGMQQEAAMQRSGPTYSPSSSSKK